MLHYRIHGFLHTELLVRNSFQSEAFRLRAAIKTQRSANIWKTALASIPPSDYAPVFDNSTTVFKFVVSSIEEASESVKTVVDLKNIQSM